MKLFVAFAAAVLLTAPLLAAPCRDAKGKFVKCDAVKGATIAQGNFTKDAKGKCHVVNPAPGQRKGQFIPCPK